MPFYEKGPVRIRYEEVGSGFPPEHIDEVIEHARRFLKAHAKSAR